MRNVILTMLGIGIAAFAIKPAQKTATTTAIDPGVTFTDRLSAHQAGLVLPDGTVLIYNEILNGDVRCVVANNTCVVHFPKTPAGYPKAWAFGTRMNGASIATQDFNIIKEVDAIGPSPAEPPPSLPRKRAVPHS